MFAKDYGICIRAIDYSDTSQIVTFFTRENGSLGAIAKGSKRAKSAFGGPIEVLTGGAIAFSSSENSGLATLTEFEQKPLCPAVISRPSAFYCCLFAMELLNSFIDEHDPHPHLFDSFSDFLENVNDSVTKGASNRTIIILLILFQLSLLKQTGIQPVIDRCTNCRKELSETQKAYFSSSANGLLCMDCEGSFPEKVRISAKTVQTLSNLRRLREADPRLTAGIEKLLIYHFREKMHKMPKMAKYILQGLKFNQE